MPCRLLYRLAHVIVAVEIEDVSDEVESILIIGDLGVEAREVESIRQVVLIDFAKVFVALGADELQVGWVIGKPVSQRCHKVICIYWWVLCVSKVVTPKRPCAPGNVSIVDDEAGI